MARQLDRRSFLRTAAVLGGATMAPAMIRLRPSWAQGKKVPVGSLLDKTGGIKSTGCRPSRGRSTPSPRSTRKAGLADPLRAIETTLSTMLNAAHDAGGALGSGRRRRPYGVAPRSGRRTGARVCLQG